MLKKYIIPIVMVIVIIVVIFIFAKKEKKKPVIQEPNYVELTKTIDSLNNKVEILKLQNDSLEHSIKDSKVQIVTKTKAYEKKLIDITNQPIAFDVQFFSDYLSKTNK
jgi:uncharacterized protein YlxW (UPF0749 family)